MQGDDTIVKAENATETENNTTATASTEHAGTPESAVNAEKSSGNMPLVVGGIVAVAAAVAAGIFIKKRKN